MGQKCQNFQKQKKKQKRKTKKEINQKSEKTFPKQMYLDGFGNFFFVIFVQKYIFLPLLKKIWAKNHCFGDFSKHTILAKNLMI